MISNVDLPYDILNEDVVLVLTVDENQPSLATNVYANFNKPDNMLKTYEQIIKDLQQIKKEEIENGKKAIKFGQIAKKMRLNARSAVDVLDLKDDFRYDPVEN